MRSSFSAAGMKLLAITFVWLAIGSSTAFSAPTNDEPGGIGAELLQTSTRLGDEVQSGLTCGILLSESEGLLHEQRAIEEHTTTAWRVVPEKARKLGYPTTDQVNEAFRNARKAKVGMTMLPFACNFAKENWAQLNRTALKSAENLENATKDLIDQESKLKPKTRIKN